MLKSPLSKTNTDQYLHGIYSYIWDYHELNQNKYLILIKFSVRLNDKLLSTFQVSSPQMAILTNIL